jgi:hypothetical protein
VFKHPPERHYIRPEIASDLLACARAGGAKTGAGCPLSAGENNKLRRVSPNFSERDGMEFEPFEFRKRASAPSKKFETARGKSETNGQG